MNKTNYTLNDIIRMDYNRRGDTSPIPISNEMLDSQTLKNTDRLVNESISNTKRLQAFDSELWKDYADYDVFLTSRKTQEQLDKERAENQTALEQFNNMMIQGVGSEIVLGTLKGLSDLIISLPTDIYKGSKSAITGEKDFNTFTNPISKFLEDTQDKLRNEFAIYQKNPGKSFDGTDFGWWMNNTTSVFSTLSLLIPSTGIIKGLSYLGKFGKSLAKVNKVLGKSTNLLGKTGKLNIAARVANQANPTKAGQYAELFGNALLS